MLRRYRASGADLPFADRGRPRGAGMEGAYWRVTDASSATALVVFAAVSRDRDDERWGMAGLAAHPAGEQRSAVLEVVEADGHELRLSGEGGELRAGRHGVEVTIGDAHARVEIGAARGWPRRRPFGGQGPGQLIPALSQYWHPLLLGAPAALDATVAGQRLACPDARAYAEQTWGGDGFPPQWWWGEAHDFAGDDACVAFAGGPARALGVDVLGTSVVVRAGGELARLTRPPALLRVSAGEHGWRICGRTARHALELEGEASAGPPLLLPVPVPAERRLGHGVAAQHLDGELRVRLRRGRRTVFAGTSRLAGLERGGPPRR